MERHSHDRGEPSVTEAKGLLDPAAFIDEALGAPELVVHTGNLPVTAVALRDLLAKSARFYDRGGPVRVVPPADGDCGPPSAVPFTRSYVVVVAHQLCRPVKVNSTGERTAVTLPDRVAQMYLEMVGEWRLPPLTGMSTAPLLSGDGTIRSFDGYERETGLWCARVPTLAVSEHPTRIDAVAALRLLRGAFRTFPFGDGRGMRDAVLGVDVIDEGWPAGQDESAFLTALLTAICRPSLPLAPGLLLNAPAISGAGSGKGLLVRAICTIAFGVIPRAFTTGGERHELDKRLAAELVDAQPVLFLDNANGIALRSDTLASVLTERPTRVRVLGETRMVLLNSTAFIAVTGNGLTVTEDLARRFITCNLDPRCEDAESRPFPAGFLSYIERRRAELLTAALTIWRWGRQSANELKRGKPLGSFEMWAEWCRDPLVDLGCCDPVERIEKLKAQDPRRQRIAELFRAGWENHASAPMKANDLAEAVKTIADPQDRGRQYLATFLSGLAGTHAAEFILTRQEAAGKWTAATYALTKAEPVPMDPPGHRTHRPNGSDATGSNSPMSPMGPNWGRDRRHRSNLSHPEAEIRPGFRAESRVVTYESECGQLKYVCERVRCVREPQLRAAWLLCAHRARDDARPDDGGGRRRGGERPPADDAHTPDASVPVPCASSIFRD